MNSSLENLCLEKIQSLDYKNLDKILPPNLYDSYTNYLIRSNFNGWKNKMKIVNLEVNIEDMDVNYDMFLDTPTYHIFVKKKIEDLE